MIRWKLDRLYDAPPVEAVVDRLRPSCKRNGGVGQHNPYRVSDDLRPIALRGILHAVDHQYLGCPAAISEYGRRFVGPVAEDVRAAVVVGEVRHDALRGVEPGQPCGQPLGERLRPAVAEACAEEACAEDASQ